MKLRHYTIITTLALLAASCAHEESEVAQISDIQLAITAAFATPAADFAAAGVGVGDEFSTEKPAKSATKATTTAFESGDMLGLYAVKSGGELNAASNLINNHQLKVSQSGAITGDLAPAYYPDKSSSLDLFSYYPYQSGNATADALGVLVGIRTHQTDFSSLQASDLCYGRKLDAATSAAPHPLQFRHSFAQLRLNFSLYEGCSAISAVKLLAIKDSAKLNLQTGLVTLLPHTADVSLYVGSSSNSADATNPLQFTAIIPAQSLSGACVEITLTDGTIYYYHATSPIALRASATNTLNLTLSDKGKLTLTSTPTITAWGAVSASGSLGDTVNNLITLYWLAPHADYAKSDKVTLTITDPLGVTSDVDLTPTLNPMSSTAYAVLDLPLTLVGTSYPLTISRVCIYNGATMLRDATATTMVGKTITKSGSHTLGINSPEYIIINGLKWATMNVGATNPWEYGNLFNWTDAINACPSGWRLPTVQEHVALSRGGYSSQTSLNQVTGWWIGSMLNNTSSSIFLPASGWRETDGTMNERGKYVYCWSSTSTSSTHAYNLRFSTYFKADHNDRKNAAFTARCVSN